MEQKKAIIIGASSGIGRALAVVLSRNGYITGVMARRGNLLNRLKEEEKGDIRVRRTDLAHTEEAAASLKGFIDELGGVELIIISAGRGDVNNGLEWQKERDTIDINVTGFAALAGTTYKYFEKKGCGHLACISSVAALRGGTESPAYNASKAFVSVYMEGLRLKAVKSKIPVHVTDIRPGFVDTAMAKGEGLFWVSSPLKAAVQIFKAIKKKKRVVYITKRWNLVAFLIKLMPLKLYARF